MIVPEYWAEAKQKTVVNGRQITIKRFGWSDLSEAEALANARTRVEEAMALAKAGQKVRRFDHKISYNGAEGLPIREEIISRHNDAVITRNSYGALCLNTPDVLFADIDFEHDPSIGFYLMAFLLLFPPATFTGWYFASWGLGVFLVFLAANCTWMLALGLRMLVTAIKGGPKKSAMAAIKVFSRKNPSWHLRVYRTPKGYRVLVMHKTFVPNDDETLRFFKKVGADPLYVRMCKNQHCFRARISPKPWRIGMARLGPRPGVWPIKAERMPARKQWVSDYQQAAKKYASCRLITKLGSDKVDPKAEQVCAIHDDYCRAQQGLKLA